MEYPHKIWKPSVCVCVCAHSLDHTNESTPILIFNFGNFNRSYVVCEGSPLAAGHGIMFLLNTLVRSRISQVIIENLGQVGQVGK